MTLLAGFKVLLYRYSGEHDMVVGATIGNRSQAETEKLIGFFVNTLVLRTDLSGNPSFRELLRRVREAVLEALADKDLPYEKLVEELHPARELSHTPLFQVLFTFQEAPTKDWRMPGLSLRLCRTESTTAKFDLTLSMIDTGSGLVGSLEYNADLFEAHSIKRMLRHFQKLLEGIVENPDQRISALPLLTPKEKRRVSSSNGMIRGGTTPLPSAFIACLRPKFQGAQMPLPWNLETAN